MVTEIFTTSKNEGQKFWVDDYGATGDGHSLDDDAIEKAISDAKKVGGKVVFGARQGGVRKYRLSREIRLQNDWSGVLHGNSVVVEFSGSIFSTQIHFEPIKKFDVLFRYGQQARFIGDICVIRYNQPDSLEDYRGVVFATQESQQTTLDAERIFISGRFMFGKFHRFTLWERIGRFESYHAKCHIAYSNCELSQLVSDAEDEAGIVNFSTSMKVAPETTDTWNNQPPTGWFHNSIHYGLVYCEGGEVGIYGSPMCMTIDQLTTQGQKIAKRTSNEILPLTSGGTGCYFFGYSFSKLRAGISISSWYTEVTERPLYIEHANGIVINTMFAQGFYANDNTINKNNALPCIDSNSGGEVNITLLRIDGFFDSIICANGKTSVNIQSLENGKTWISNKTVNLSKDKVHYELATCHIGDWKCSRINYEFSFEQGRVGHICVAEIDITAEYLINVSGSVDGTWIDSPTILHLKNGVFTSITGVYHSLLVNRGYLFSVREIDSNDPLSKFLPTRLGILELHRDSRRFKANMSIAITQISNSIAKLTPI